MFQYKRGASDGPKDLRLSRHVDFSVAEIPPWLSAAKSPNGLTVQVANRDLAPGSYRGTVRIAPHSWRAKNRFALVPVSLTILPPVEVRPDKITLYSTSGATSRQLQVTGTARFTVKSDQRWLQAVRHDQTLRISADPADKNVGPYKATVSVTDEESGIVIYVPVVLHVLPSGS